MQNRENVLLFTGLAGKDYQAGKFPLQHQDVNSQTWHQLRSRA